MPAETDLFPQTTYQKLLEFIKDIKYGSVTIIVQDGKIVQIEKNEKVRLK